MWSFNLLFMCRCKKIHMYECKAARFTSCRRLYTNLIEITRENSFLQTTYIAKQRLCIKQHFLPRELWCRTCRCFKCILLMVLNYWNWLVYKCNWNHLSCKLDRTGHFMWAFKCLILVRLWCGIHFSSELLPRGSHTHTHMCAQTPT